MRSTLLALFLCAGPLSAQASDSHRNYAVQLHVSQASGWKLTETHDDGSLKREAKIKSALGVGVRAILPGFGEFHPMLEFNKAFSGSNGYTIARAGIEWDGKAGHSAPAMTLTVGRVHESGGASFTQVAAGAGVTFRVWQWIGVRGEMEYGIKVSKDQDNHLFGAQSSHIHVEGDIARFLIGFRAGSF